MLTLILGIRVTNLLATVNVRIRTHAQNLDRFLAGYGSNKLLYGELKHHQYAAIVSASATLINATSHLFLQELVHINRVAVRPTGVSPRASASWLVLDAMNEGDIDYWRDSMRPGSGESFQRAWYRSFRTLLLVVFAAVPLLAWAGEQDVATGSVAAAIREAGYPCAHVVDMERSTEGVSQGLTVWKVRCNSGQFKVTFKGDTGSEVVPLD